MLIRCCSQPQVPYNSATQNICAGETNGISFEVMRLTSDIGIRIFSKEGGGGTELFQFRGL